MGAKFFLLISVLLLGSAAHGGISGSKHDFSRETWSAGRTCAVCHGSHLRTIRKFPPDSSPAGVMLTAEEKAAIQANPANRLCFECHRPKDGGVEQDGGHSIVEPKVPGGSSAGPEQPPSFGSGTRAGACFRVNSQGSIAGKDCVSCHDVHDTEAPNLLRKQTGIGQN